MDASLKQDLSKEQCMQVVVITTAMFIFYYLFKHLTV